MDILEYFFEEPEKKFYVRELAKLTKKSPTTISKYLDILKKKDLLIVERKYNHLLFKADSESKIFKNLKLTCNLRKIIESGLIDYLEEEFNYPEAIILFGSFRKAENIPISDIDLMLISPIKKEIDLEKFEKILKHKIHLLINSKESIEKFKEKNKELLNNLINGIVIYGYWELYR
jgi:predicted nucleotidyltransferase/DNA-binding transcriptional ArsR family regulator